MEQEGAAKQEGSAHCDGEGAGGGSVAWAPSSAMGASRRNHQVLCGHQGPPHPSVLISGCNLLPQVSLNSSEQREIYLKGLEFQLKRSPRNDSGKRSVLNPWHAGGKGERELRSGKSL